MFTKKDLFLLVPTLAVVVVPNAFANIPSTAYMEDYVATEIGNLGALATKDAVTTSEITDGTIATADIADNAITTAKIAASAITTAKIKDLNVTTAKIAASAVTSAKIADATITNDDIATNAAIAASKISGLAKVATSGSYNDLSNKPTLGALASKNAVTTSEITDGTIATVDIADNAVTSAKIKDATITNDDIATDAAIAASKISGLATVATSGSYNDLLNKPSIPSAYTLPVATTTVLGGVKQGDNVTIASDGKISVVTGNGSTLGVVKAGTNTTITSGAVNVATGTPSTLGVVKVGQIPSGSATSTTYATIWVE